MDGIKYFLDLLDVSPFWPVFIVSSLFALCTIPYKPVAKIKETKDKDGNVTYTVYKHRD